MEQQMTEFEGLLSEGDARREAFDSASAELAKYKKTVESLLVTSAENKTQAYVSATSNLPMFNEHIESYMNQMLEITGEQMAQAQGQMEQSAARVPMIVAVASLVLLAVVVVIMLGLRIWVIGPVKYATRQVDEQLGSAPHCGLQCPMRTRQQNSPAQWARHPAFHRRTPCG